MWYSKCSWTLVVLVALFALVTGSCLEYGHSCWGAHGKRSGGKAVVDAKQPLPGAYALDSVVEQLYNNNNQNNNNNNNQNNQDDNNNSDDDSNDITITNSGNNLPLAAPAILKSEDRRIGGLKWAQLMRQHRYQLRQLQDQQPQQQGRGRGRGRQYDAAAESWRKLQQALQAQIDADNENSGYELTK
ncbi:neuropeptide CCHamide-1 isoform X2 [Drosophila santomea]|uniref:neuropeptide CCHamide-1 isoform X2 n=1 Tax=Drosophila santomea TaxID=129105 RepID=UPI001954B6CB|nr:neuropeptide CCHamide-1 isoform X2 [Drosophila santomea]